MTKTKSTKRALLGSALALLVCVSMLIGSTFAWFTDSVTSAGNKIVAGTLDIQLLMDADVDGTYDDISDSTSPIFGAGSIAQNNNAETLWEPGKTQVVYLAIKNNGNLDLKYTVGLNVQNVSKDLYEVMEYAIVPDADANNKVIAWNGGNSVVVGTQSVSGDVELKVGETHYFALAIHMDEEAGNEYQGGEVNFDLTVLATQLTSEFDSFDNQYDKDADYVVEVKTADELATALRAGGLVKLANDISVTETLTVPAGVTVNLDLNGKTITGGYQTGSTTNHIYAIDNKGTLTLKNGTINSRGVNNYGTITLESGTINSIDGNGGYGVHNYAGASFVMNGGTIATTLEDDHQVDLGGYDATTLRVESGSTFEMNGGVINNICDFTFAIDNYGTVAINAGKVSSVHTTVSNRGTLTVNGGELVCNGVNGKTQHVILASAGTTTINNGTFDGKDSYNGFNVDAAAGATVIINGGSFLPVHSGSLYGEGTITVYGGTFANDVSDRVATGYAAVKNDDGTYTVVKGVTNVSDLTAAIKKGGKVVLTDNIELTGNLMPTKDVVIDLNGNTIKTTASTSMFQSQSNAHPSMIITSSKAGAVIDATNSNFINGIVHSYGKTEIRNVTINAGSNRVVQVQGTHGSVEIYDTVINVASGNPFSVAGDFTLGEGTVVNVTNLNSSFINNNGKHNIVIDGAKINVGKFRVNGGAMISLASGTTLALKNTEIKVGLDTTYTSYFISRAENATIENCTFDIKEYAGTKEYDIEFVPDASVGAKYAWKQK